MTTRDSRIATAIHRKSTLIGEVEWCLSPDHGEHRLGRDRATYARYVEVNGIGSNRFDLAIAQESNSSAPPS